MDKGSGKAIEYFSRTASAYVTSSVHAQGEDLQALGRLLGSRRFHKGLDVATGAGHTALAIGPFCDEVVASDLTPAMLEKAREHLSGKGVSNIRFQVAEAEKLPFPNGHFDLVTCRLAAHHFHSPARFVGEVYRVLGPNGVFILSDLIAPQPPALDQFVNWAEKLRDSSHVRSYTEKEWRGLVEQTGFAIVSAESLAFPQDFAEWTARAQLEAAQVELLSREMLSQPESARQELGIEADKGGGLVRTFAFPRLVLKAQRPPPPNRG